MNKDKQNKTKLITLRVEQDLYDKYCSCVGKGNISKDLRKYIESRINQTTVKTELQNREQELSNDITHLESQRDLIRQQIKEIEQIENDKELKQERTKKAIQTIKDMANSKERENNPGITNNEIDRVAKMNTINQYDLRKLIEQENIKIISEIEKETLNTTLKDNTNHNKQREIIEQITQRIENDFKEQDKETNILNYLEMNKGQYVNLIEQTNNTLKDNEQINYILVRNNVEWHIREREKGK